ncbi:formylglycine-generating enzyme family protein [Tolypothrix sp. PCC 7910]|uniref:formylglycine-generating enzyme family protein n=1 Tax=Tolypothrix sp. PCC 7910 TaxID=2099387 RepID=UPI0014277D1B|nr:formylglycine-generating enzyme family protein [Tolypothrix sp. PCC 7910]QIR40309.1 formylglycine-generating enzyme family protein [Tolypothrix sp. PCC 7910]
MANLSSSLIPPENREDLTTRRIRVFARRYGMDALFLAYHAAFPLTLTSDLLYCLRENFVPDCPWYAVADVLLSGLCQPAGYDLYEMEGKTRDCLLQRLCNEFGEERLKALANFMSQYIAYHLQSDSSERALVFGERPQWTALAYLSPDAQEAINAIKQELQKLTATADAKERIRWAALVESYADLLSEKGFQPLLLKWSQQTLDGQPIQDEEMQLAAAMGVSLEFFDFELAIIVTEDEPTEELKPFGFETVTVNAQGKVIKKEQNQAFYFVESLGEVRLEMVAIPGGQFLMGSPPDEPERDDDESPQHEVTVQPFFLAKYPVTQAQWRFVAQLPQINRELDPDPSEFQGDNRPVEQVSWDDAVEFCDRLSQYTGRPYRLPSEAEWEYACRAGTTSPFHFGETITTDLANYDGNYTYGDAPKGVYQGETTPVGSFGVANAFGLYDMHGNVDEWCMDNWHENYESAPKDGSAWLIDNNNNSHRLLRGGSWDYNPGICRSADRYNDLDADYRYNNIGFRVACAGAWTQ